MKFEKRILYASKNRKTFSHVAKLLLPALTVRVLPIPISHLRINPLMYMLSCVNQKSETYDVRL